MLLRELGIAKKLFTAWLLLLIQFPLPVWSSGHSRGSVSVVPVDGNVSY